MKSLAKKLLGNRLLGVIDYYRLPRDSWNGPFNGQQFRQKIFRELVAAMKFQAIIETGTFRGTTTEFMRDVAQLPIYTVEFDPRTFAYAQWRFRGQTAIKNSQGDSRQFLRRLLTDAALTSQRLFFYLDAHWGADLPLAEECEIIYQSCSHAVIMIDDFKVPGDDGYRFDDYGAGKALCLEYLHDVNRKYQAAAFFPAQRSQDETGLQRGCGIFANHPELVQQLQQLSTLTRYSQAG